ncbi:P-loop containing nucleoside triphosphate hydrolase protein [Phlyctochytrium arcticum]|nr:P-loop containing nucleoside triphosphate hydrolase protein [Phlyctochytrium arcticum]
MQRPLTVWGSLLRSSSPLVWSTARPCASVCRQSLKKSLFGARFTLQNASVHTSLQRLSAAQANMLEEEDVIDAVNGYGAGKSQQRIKRSPTTSAAAPISEDLDVQSVEILVDEENVASAPVGAKFSSCKALSPQTLRAMRDDFQFETMSPVQEAVLSLLPTQKDLLVRAKTGTGKTLAFLIAALESALSRNEKRLDSRNVSILIMSPTRELALQIAAEASKLLSAHRYHVQTAVGGPGRNRSVESLTQRKVDVVVGTPGRVLDMLSNVPAFKRRCEKLQTLIFDEADQLLEMGFSDEMSKICSHLPTDRQTFMFSATLSSGIKAIARNTLRENYDYIDTVPVNDVPTHLSVRQTYAMLPYSQQLPVLHHILSQHRKDNPAAKIIVFFSTTKVVSFLSGVFNDIPGMDIMEIHSKLTQVQRSRVAARFRRAHSAVLFTTDVSARGVDYPGVTLVLQVGAPSSSDQYVHRIGRTGRAGKSGEGVILLSPYERKFLDDLKHLPIKKDLRYEAQAGVARDPETKQIIQEAMNAAPRDLASDCYVAYLGYSKFLSRLLLPFFFSQLTLYFSY